MLKWEIGIAQRDSKERGTDGAPKVPWYGGSFVPVEHTFKPIPYDDAAAKHFTREEIDLLNQKGLLAHELRPKEWRYTPPERLSKRAQREIFGRTGHGPFAKYVRGGLLTRNEVKQINEDYAKNLADPNFKPIPFGPFKIDQTHVDLMRLQDYLDGWYPLDLLMRDWKEHFKTCYGCTWAFVYYERLKLQGGFDDEDDY